nr:pyridoxamine 5'-phosphate oxidase family protein usto [Quercus suber]
MGTRTATAPLAGDGHVNVSPKGGQDFGIVDEKSFWYLDLSGSGNETISHLLEPGNGRITIQFCAFDGPPKIVRFWGQGSYQLRHAPAWHALDHRRRYPPSGLVVRVQRAVHGLQGLPPNAQRLVGEAGARSRGWKDRFSHAAVSVYSRAHVPPPFVLTALTDRRRHSYWAYKNAYSMDGLPGLPQGLRTAKEETIAPIKKMVGPLAPLNRKLYRSRSREVSQAVLLVLTGFLLGMLVTLYGPMMLPYVREWDDEKAHGMGNHDCYRVFEPSNSAAEATVFYQE